MPVCLRTVRRGRHPVIRSAPAKHVVGPGSLGLMQPDPEAHLWEAAADQTPGIDPWCSGPDWVMPAHDAFGANADLLCIDDPTGLALLARFAPGDEPPDGPELDTDGTPAFGWDMTIIGGREPLWGFACPILTAMPDRFGAIVAEQLAADDSWDRLLFPGFPRDGVFLRAFGGHLARLGRAGGAEGITRQVADLSGGYDAWLARRRPRFRRNLRNAQRRADDAGLVIDDQPNTAGLYDRLLSIEHRSWKGLEDSGITGPGMEPFYRTMLERLIPAGRLRAAIARLDGVDVGFIIGGVRGARYRGLQISYTTDVAALSVGRLLQHHEIKRQCSEGTHTYDLGMDIEYKQQWADHAEGSLLLVVDR